MAASELYFRLRHGGVGRKRAVRLVGYAALADEVGWENLELTDEQVAEIQAALQATTTDMGSHPAKRHAHRTGVSVSGVVTS